MTCRDIPATAVPTYDTMQQMYVGLGVRRLPSGVHANVDSTLPSTGLNLGALTPESVACFNALAGIRGGSRYRNTPLHANIRELRGLVDYFRGAGNSHGAANTGDPNVITGAEIDAYVHAYGEGKTDFNAQEYRDLTVANLSAYLAVVDYVGGGTPSVPHTPGVQEENAAAIRTYGSVQQMYTGLIGEESGTTRASVSEEMPEGGIALGVLNEANIQGFADALGWNPEAAPTTPLARNAKEILDLVDYFRGDGNLANGDAATITSNEVDAYVRAYVAQARSEGNRSITFDGHRQTVVGNLRALVACVEHVATLPEPTPPVASPRPHSVGFFTRVRNFVGDHWGQVLVGVGTLLGAGALYAVRRSLQTQPANRVVTPTPQNTGTTVIVNGPAVEVRAENAPVVQPQSNGYDAVLADLPNGATVTPPPLSITSQQGFVARIATSPVDHELIAGALGQTDPALETYYRTHVVNGRSSITMSELLAFFEAQHPAAHGQAVSRVYALLSDGRSAEQLTERLVFELVADASGVTYERAESRELALRAFETAYDRAYVASNSARSEGNPSTARREDQERNRTETTRLDGTHR